MLVIPDQKTGLTGFAVVTLLAVTIVQSKLTLAPAIEPPWMLQHPFEATTESLTDAKSPEHIRLLGRSVRIAVQEESAILIDNVANHIPRDVTEIADTFELRNRNRREILRV